MGCLCFPDKLGWLAVSPPPLVLLSELELEATADEPGAVGTALRGVLPRGPQAFGEDCRNEGLCGSPGAPGQTFVLSWSPRLGEIKGGLGQFLIWGPAAGQGSAGG